MKKDKKSTDSTARHSVLILNGPNLNMVGIREPGIYGKQSLGDLEAQCRQKADLLGLDMAFRQSNLEGALVSMVQTARHLYQGIILNAGAYTHTSIALHDAIKAADVPLVEVHLSNTLAREDFRHTSFITPVAKGIIAGFGFQTYLLALDAVSMLIKD